jgi:hypothetical protein
MVSMREQAMLVRVRGALKEDDCIFVKCVVGASTGRWNPESFCVYCTDWLSFKADVFGTSRLPHANSWRGSTRCNRRGC